jgi:hypothetical protein
MFNRRLQINILRTDPGDQMWKITLQEIGDLVAFSLMVGCKTVRVKSNEE